jgi:D-arabinose 1-dehydrogenase-like Zn-dependent alcohol dehydrogenase
MRAFAVKSFGEPVAAIEQSNPVPTGTEVLVEVMRCGVCHSDLHLQDGYYDMGGGKRLNLVDRGITPPVILGHEILGRVLAKGPEAPIGDAAIGQSFLVYPWIGCGSCAYCLSAQDNMCAMPSSIGVFRPGGYAEQCLVPHPRYLVDVSGIEPSVAATYACSGLTAYSALQKAHIDQDRDLLLLIGLGGVGLSALSIASGLGFKRVAVADIDPEKRQAALVSGARVSIDPRDAEALSQLKAIGGVALAVDFVGKQSTAELAVASLRKGGTCVVVGLFGGEITLSIPAIVQRAITLRGSYVGSLLELKELVSLGKAGRISELPIETVPFDSVNSALDRLRRGHVRGRIVLAR